MCVFGRVLGIHIMNPLGNETQKELETRLVSLSSPPLLSLPSAPHSILGGNSIYSRTQASTAPNSTSYEHHEAFLRIVSVHDLSLFSLPAF